MSLKSVSNGERLLYAQSRPEGDGKRRLVCALSPSQAGSGSFAWSVHLAYFGSPYVFVRNHWGELLYVKGNGVDDR